MISNSNITYLDIPAFIASVTLSEQLSVPRPHAKDLESENGNFESEAIESYVGHTDEERKQPYPKPARTG